MGCGVGCVSTLLEILVEQLPDLEPNADYICVSTLLEILAG